MTVTVSIKRKHWMKGPQGHKFLDFVEWNFLACIEGQKIKGVIEVCSASAEKAKEKVAQYYKNGWLTYEEVD